MPYKLEDFQVLEIIGCGTTGTCYKVRNKFSNELFVWKAVDYGPLTEEHKRMLVSEVNLLRSLNNPHIVKYCGRILHKETTTLYIITEWCEGGDLCRIIKDAKESGRYLEEWFIWRMLYQISRAIQVCHSQLRDCTIFHRDIKPSNIFLDGHGNAKLGDFGLATVVSTETEFTKTFVGTPYYMSPELVKGRKYNRKSDIWALGCLVYELCALVPPFNASTITDLADTIKRGKYKSIPSRYSENLKRIISFMLSKKHEFRPTIEMILHHPTVVMNIKAETNLGSSKQFLRPKVGEDDSGGSSKHLGIGLENLTLIDPEHISNKVFKEKWAEKQETLREREAWLRRREKSIGYKERSLANWEKHLQLLVLQVKEKQNAIDHRILKRKEEDNHTGHETDATVEPSETPLRPTSAKLDPHRFPRPEILTNACKMLEKHTDLTNRKKNGKYTESNSNNKESSSQVRRTLILNKEDEKGLQVKNKLLNSEQSKFNRRPLRSVNQVEQLTLSLSKAMKTNKDITKCKLLNVKQVINIKDKKNAKENNCKQKATS